MKNKLVLRDSSTFEEAVRLLDENGNGFLPVVDDEERLIGILTDGDIRRAVLNHKTDLKDIINKQPVTVKEDMPKKKAISFLKSIRRKHLPVVDDADRLIDIIVLDDLEFNKKPNKAVIMAGGMGKRLGDLTKDTPKPMLPLGKRPIMEVLINSFADVGITDIYISLNYKKEKIKKYFGDGGAWGVNIHYLEEGKRLGTAGALGLIDDDLNAPFIVINGDILTTLDFDELLRFHNKMNAFATICVKEHKTQLPYGVIELEANRVRGMREKPEKTYYINAGIYVFDPEVISLIPRNEYYDITVLFDALLRHEKNVCSYILNDYWIDIGHIDDYEYARKNFKNIM